MERDFFISRTGDDKAIAVVIADIVRAAGCTTWLQDEDFGHASFMARMAQGFSSGARMVALLSKAYQESEFCKKEYENVLAGDPRNLEERLIVLRIEDIAPVEHLKDLAYTDLVPVLNDASELARVVRIAIGAEARPSEYPYFVAPRAIIHPSIEAMASFTGREEELDAIDAVFRSPAIDKTTKAALTDSQSMAAAIRGLGGVGKSVIARQYAWIHRKRFQGVWWIRAEDIETMIEDLLSLGARLIPNIQDRPDREAAVHTVLDYISHLGSAKGHRPWLLIYDNVEQPEEIETMTPREGACILITSRWTDWYGYAQELPIDTFPPATAEKYLLERSRDHDREAAGRLAKDLGYLPLALEHARTYCWRTRCGFENYRSRLPDLIRKAPKSARYPETVFATFDLAIDDASKASPAAEALIGLLAFFAPEHVPPELISAAIADEDQRDEAVSALANVSLVAYTAFDDGSPSISLHRLVQEVARGRLGENGPVAISRGLDAMLALWPTGNDGENPQFWPLCSRLLPHALVLLEQTKAHECSDEKTALLLSLVGFHLSSRGAYSTVEPLYRRALEIRQHVLGEYHADTANSYNNVASNLNAQGKYEAAEPLYRRALEIRQRVLGEYESNTAASYNNVAANLNAQGQYDQAEPLFRRGLEISQRVLGEDHPDTAASYNNVAANLNAQGQYDQAEPLFRRGLEIRQRVLGEDHPDTAASYNNVAANLNAQGQYDQAEPLFRRGLEISQRVLGEDHPDTAGSYNNVASNFDDQGKYEAAEPLYRRALEIRQRVLGADHPFTAVSYNNVAYNLDAQGRLEEAEPLFRRALAILKTTLPPRHPHIEAVQTSLQQVQAKMDQ